HTHSPSYLTDLLHQHTPTCNLRSADANLLSPLTRSKALDLGFSIAAPSLWNSLSPNTSDIPHHSPFQNCTQNLPT
ncbi:hypothetical protein LDENG_00273130, partial [Lucifuga dentata]